MFVTVSDTDGGDSGDPVDSADTDGDGTIDRSELNGAISDWSLGEYSLSELREIIFAWASGG